MKRTIKEWNREAREDWLNRIDKFKKEWNDWKKQHQAASEEEHQKKWEELLKDHELNKINN